MGDFQGHPFRGNQWSEDGARVGESNAPTVARGDFRAGATTGSAPTADDNPSGRFDSAAKRALAKAEGTILARSTERAFVWKEDGSPVLSKDGGASNVEFDPDDVEAMSGGVLTHNHPSGGPLSSDDIYLTMRANLREMRAVGSNGMLYRLGMTGKHSFNGVQPANGTYHGWSLEMRDTYRTLLGESIVKTQKRINSGEISQDQANAHWAEEHHAIMLRFAKTYAREGVYYKRTSEAYRSHRPARGGMDVRVMAAIVNR